MATPNLLSITSCTPVVLTSSQLASGDTAVFTVAAGKAAKLNPLVLCNTSAAAVVVSAGIVPSGGAVDGTHKVVAGLSIAAGETVTLDEFAGQWLGDGDKVNVNAGTGAAIDATLTGLVFA